MKTKTSIALIACVKEKNSYPTKAENLYISTWFRVCSAYVKSHYKDWFILSAKYGLVKPYKILNPYNYTLYEMTIIERVNWSEKVFKKLSKNISDLPNYNIDIYAGVKYREHLIKILENNGIEYSIPLKGLGIGQQLQTLKRWNE